MAELIKPLLNGRPYESTAHRFLTMFQPIQETETKHSDFLAFVATPVLDFFVLDTVFAVDASIRLLNATASLLKAAYTWTLNQQKTSDLFDKATERELDAFVDNIHHIFSSLLAQIVNILFSAVSLITRPIASIAEALSDDSMEERTFRPI
ncbi:hypothetical protein [Legionella quateirensis]|uniref:Uncharacterized protein n=1 Tax=Legionella quateirensis TaxID=45072 RepID=A0A378KZQ4_9GAMM|nr:hypothetical protein [Legionella quateirensis]KTD43681.1 hypothetical protein Lqua_3035 [Legionella quateirensis]STY17330.1 Uncharacterised protein [Legionella quateirensis]